MATVALPSQARGFKAQLSGRPYRIFLLSKQGDSQMQKQSSSFVLTSQEVPVLRVASELCTGEKILCPL